MRARAAGPAGGSRSILTETAAFAAVAAGLGLSFGVVASAVGVSPPLAATMSLLIYGGAAQFALLGVAAAGGPMTAAFVSGVLLNARFAPLALSVAPRLRTGVLWRVAAAPLVCDPNVAQALARPAGPLSERLFWVSGVTVYVAWVGATLVGALVGAAIPDPQAIGMDAALPAMLLGLLAPQVRGRQQFAAVLAGAAIALITLPLVPAGVPVLLAGFGAVGALRVRVGPVGRAADDPGGRSTGPDRDTVGEGPATS
jgi:4-azaleucine resistance transporter AzlC